MMPSVFGERGDSSSLQESLEKPILIYISTRDPKAAKKLKTWEESRLADDKLISASKFFKCYIIDEDSLPKENPISGELKKNHAPSFMIYTNGKFNSGTGSKPSSSKIFTIMKKTVSKLYGVSMDSIVKKGVDFLKEIEKVDIAKKEVEKQLNRLKDKDRKKAKYKKERDELVNKINELKAKEAKLYDLKPKSIAKK